ncbi:IS6 family transposase [Belnapia sp. T18]|uniref:IS6 family transposase n=1 Tax=Belnapia arida TaxID=2804533 RepID=A0ABS1UD68_9PROT|nr:IS6 family transposase [Belnapia arida]MBL6082632.1 IS6 family transposase [Belnapia arida]
MTPEFATYSGYRFPAEIISHAVWLDYVFSLNLRDVELILAEQGIGGTFARKLRRRRPKRRNTWHVDEVFLKIKGELH